MTEIEKILSQNLKRLRDAKKITQDRLAEMVGVTLPGFQNWESMRSWPKPASIEKIAKALQVKQWELFADYDAVVETGVVLADQMEKSDKQSQKIGALVMENDQLKSDVKQLRADPKAQQEVELLDAFRLMSQTRKLIVLFLATSNQAYLDAFDKIAMTKVKAGQKNELVQALRALGTLAG